VGCIPLTPFCNLVNLMRGNRNVGGCPSGGGGGETKSPQECYDLIFLSISTEPNHDYHQNKKNSIAKKIRQTPRKIVNHMSKDWQKKISDYKLSMLIPLKS
jgi:hypothetical protein